jgi:excisionase family DNA binding protein
MDSVSIARSTSSRPTVAQISAANGQSPVLTLTQAAEYLRVSKAHLSKVLAGKVPDLPALRHVRAGRRILIKREWIEDWLEKANQYFLLPNASI